MILRKTGSNFVGKKRNILPVLNVRTQPRITNRKIKKIWLTYFTMGQISFKIPNEEIEFLKLVAIRNGSAVSSIYRDRTLDHFKQWKLDYLLAEFEKGSIGFKLFCKLGNLTPLEGLITIETSNIDPQMPALIDEHTSKIRKELTPENLFKKGVVPKRRTSELLFDD